MGMWTAIALIVIACVVGETLRKKYENGNGSELDEKLDSLNKKIDGLDRDLRDRVETLERIVTDSKADLKRQFDHLDKAS